MNNLSTYIIEKLHLNKDIKTGDNPFTEVKLKDAQEMLNYIVEKMGSSGCGDPEVWDDTQRFNIKDYYHDFSLSNGTMIYWTRDFNSYVEGERVAIWKVKYHKKEIEEHPFIEFFKRSYDCIEQYTGEDGYEIKYWGKYKYDDNIYISMLECLTDEHLSSKIICFLVTVR